MANSLAMTGFDTYKIAQKLEASGFPKEQVQAITECLVATHENPASVSQVDFREHKAEVKADAEKREGNLLYAIKDIDFKFEALRKDMDAKFDASRKDMEVMKATIEKWLLRSTVGLGFLILAGPNPLGTLLKLFH